MLYLHPLSLPCWAWLWTNEDYVDKTNDLTYRLESHIYEEETLEARNLRIVVTLTVNPSLPKEDEYALIYYRAEKALLPVPLTRSIWICLAICLAEFLG